MSLAGKRILIVGSSSIGPGGRGTLGRQIEQELLARGAIVTFDAANGRGLAGNSSNRLAGTAEQRALFEHALSIVQPHIVLIVLGGNPSGDENAFARAMAFIAQTVARADAKLVWFGPPVYDGDAMAVTELYEQYGPKILGGNYHSSIPFTNFVEGRTVDLVHFTDAGAAPWAHAIVQEVDWTASLVPTVLWTLASIGAGFSLWRWLRARRRHA